MAENRQYDPLLVTGTWYTAMGAVDILDGRISTGDFAATTKDNPRWVREFDEHGNATRVKRNNRGGSIAITISASSPTNDALSKRAEADDLTENQVGMLVLEDLSGTTVVEADGAFLEDTPNAAFGNSRGDRVWIFQCGAIRTFIGGHDEV